MIPLFMSIFLAARELEYEILQFNTSQLYLSFRPFVREMLEQLRADFELILFSN